MSRRRKIGVAVLLVVLLPVLVVCFLLASFNPNPNRYAPQIVSAVDQATGRQLTLGGPITLQLSLNPEITATGLSLSNPPGFATPDFLKLDRIAAKIALLPLLSHRVDILQLVLVNPQLALERNASGKADWDFSAQPKTTPGSTSPARPSSNGYKIAVEKVEVQNGTLTLPKFSIAVPSLTGTADSLSSPMHLAAQATVGTTPFSLSGELGPVQRFSGVGTGPWPVNLSLQFGSAKATIIGNIDHPRTAQGYNLAISLQVPALADLTQSLQVLPNGWQLPPLQNVSVSAQLLDQGSILPAINNLSLKAGSSNLSTLRPGLVLNAADIEMSSLTSPVYITATGQEGAETLKLIGNFGAPAAILNPALLPPGAAPPGSFPVNLAAQAGAARFILTGAITTPATLAGVAVALNTSIPDLSALSPLAGQPLPAWKNIHAQTTLIDPGGLGLRNAAGLDSLTVTMDDAAFGGAASLYFGAQPRLQLAIKFTSLNLDTLRAGIPAPPPTTATPMSGATSTGRVIPDLQLPINALRKASADVQLSADTLIWNQATYTALQGHAVLANGVLTLNPVTGQLPGGSVTANARIDVTKNPAAETLALQAPALAVSPFLKAFGVSNAAQGTVQAQLAANGTGDDLRAIAASLNGQLGLAMVNGIVDGQVMDTLFGTVLRTVGLPASLVGAQGPVPVRCMALRVDASNGIGTIRTLTLDSSRLLVQGGGSVNLGDETLNIILRPQLPVAGTDVGVPVRVGGTFAAPATGVAPLSAVQAAAQQAVGLPVNIAQDVLGHNSILGAAASALGIANAGDVCPAALALGRLGQPGPAPAAMPTTSQSPASTPLGGPRSLLNSLFGK